MQGSDGLGCVGEARPRPRRAHWGCCHDGGVSLDQTPDCLIWEVGHAPAHGTREACSVFCAPG